MCSESVGQSWFIGKAARHRAQARPRCNAAPSALPRKRHVVLSGMLPAGSRSCTGSTWLLAGTSWEPRQPTRRLRVVPAQFLRDLHSHAFQTGGSKLVQQLASWSTPGPLNT